MDTIKDRLFNRNTETILEVIELDIDNPMSMVEDVLKRYIDIPNGISYVKGLRFPLSSRRDLDRYRRYGNVSEVPWHPYLMVPLLKSMLEHYQYTHTSHGDAFIENATCPGVQIYYVPPTMSSHDIILDAVPSITSTDLDTIDEIFNDVYHGVLSPIYTRAPNDIYNVDLSTDSYYLMRYMDVRAFRYMEMCDAR